MLMMSPFRSLRCDGRGLPKIIAGLSIGVEPMMRKSMSPPPSRIAAPAAARSSYSFTPGFARAIMASMARSHSTPALRTRRSSSSLWITTSSCMKPLVKTSSASGRIVAQHVVLVDRQVVVVARVDLHQPDAAALELQLLQALDHDLGVVAAAAVAHVGERIGAFAPRRPRHACRPSRTPASARRRAAPPRRTRSRATPSGR